MAPRGMERLEIVCTARMRGRAAKKGGRVGGAATAAVQLPETSTTMVMVMVMIVMVSVAAPRACPGHRLIEKIDFRHWPKGASYRKESNGYYFYIASTPTAAVAARLATLAYVMSARRRPRPGSAPHRRTPPVPSSTPSPLQFRRRGAPAQRGRPASAASSRTGAPRARQPLAAADGNANLGPHAQLLPQRASPLSDTPPARRGRPHALGRDGNGGSPLFSSPASPGFVQPTLSSTAKAFASGKVVAHGDAVQAASRSSPGGSERFRRPRPGRPHPVRMQVARAAGTNHPLGGWTRNPKHQSRHGLWYARWAQTQPHPSYDIDGDGIVSNEDLAVAREFDRDGNGVLDDDEKRELRRRIAKAGIEQYYRMPHGPHVAKISAQVSESLVQLDDRQDSGTAPEGGQGRQPSDQIDIDVDSDAWHLQMDALTTKTRCASHFNSTRLQKLLLHDAMEAKPVNLVRELLESKQGGKAHTLSRASCQGQPPVRCAGGGCAPPPPPPHRVLGLRSLCAHACFLSRELRSVRPRDGPGQSARSARSPRRKQREHLQVGGQLVIHHHIF
jgi:hypothetical protein